MQIVPSINANAYTLSAIVIGYALIDNQTPAEQNSLGNWFMLIGQVLCTNSAQQQVINNRNKSSSEGNQHIVNDSRENTYDKQINNLKNVINKMNKEINNFK